MPDLIETGGLRDGVRPGTANTTDQDERARMAVKVFRGMQPSLSAYARAITRNPKVRVEVASGAPRTDGTIIYYRPPIALGDKTHHDRFYCDKRNTEGLQICPACAIREEVLVNIYHEIAHIAFDTFAHTTDSAKRDAIDLAVQEWGGKYEEKIRTKMANAPAHIKQSYLGLAGLISPFMPYLLNAMEDSRVESAMFDARKGTRKMLQADILKLMRDGMPTDNGDERKLWRDMDLNAQISIAVYFEAVGYTGWKDYLNPKVIEDLADPDVQVLCKKLSEAKNAADTYSLTFPMLAKLRELGYYLLPEDQPQPTQDGDDSDPDTTSDSDDQTSEAGDDPGSDEGDEPSDSEEAGEGSSSSSGDEDIPDGGDDASGDEDDSSSGEEESGGSEGDSGGGPEEDASDAEESGVDQGSGESPDGGEGQDGGHAPDESGSDGGSSGGAEGLEDDPDGPSDASGEADLTDADSDGVPEESDREGSDGGTPEVSDSEGGSGSSGTEPADEGSDDSTDSDLHDASSRGDSSEGQDDQQVDGDDADERDTPGEQVPDQSDDGSSEGQSDRPGGEEAGALSDHSGPSQPVESQASDDGDAEREESRPEPQGDQSREEGDGELVDSGADEGKGGVIAKDANPEEELPQYGTPEEVAAIFEQVHPHLQPGDEVTIHGTAEEKDAVSSAVVMGTYFEWPSTGVGGVEEHRYGPSEYGWARPDSLAEDDLTAFGIIADTDIPESALSSATLKTRRIFDDNKTAAYQRNMRSGRVNAKVLGRRAWKGDDDRLFAKKRLPGRKDYAVVIGMDISSSNLGSNLALLKRSVFAQAELLSRVGIPFSIVAHSATGIGIGGRRDYTMHIHHVKDWNEPWDTQRKNAVSELIGIGGNVDGHAMEYLRKYLMKAEATDRILLYYTDGKFPAANKEEELEVLLHQLKLIKRDLITLLGVGIRTDSPVRFGLDTVQVDDDSDLQRVVEHLGKRLQRSAR
jgi:hypothetical protein